MQRTISMLANRLYHQFIYFKQKPNQQTKNISVLFPKDPMCPFDAVQLVTDRKQSTQFTDLVEIKVRNHPSTRYTDCVIDYNKIKYLWEHTQAPQHRSYIVVFYPKDSKVYIWRIDTLTPQYLNNHTQYKICNKVTNDSTEDKVAKPMTSLPLLEATSNHTFYMSGYYTDLNNLPKYVV